MRSTDLHIRIPDIRSAHHRQVDWRNQIGSRGSDGLRVGGAAPLEHQHGECKNECSIRCRNHDGQVQPVGFIPKKGDCAVADPELGGADKLAGMACPIYDTENIAIHGSIVKGARQLQIEKAVEEGIAHDIQQIMSTQIQLDLKRAGRALREVAVYGEGSGRVTGFDRASNIDHVTRKSAHTLHCPTVYRDVGLGQRPVDLHRAAVLGVAAGPVQRAAGKNEQTATIAGEIRGIFGCGAARDDGEIPGVQPVRTIIGELPGIVDDKIAAILREI